MRADETINDDLFASGRSVRVDGRVRGDVYAFAQNVTVTGVIEGDLITAGAQVVLDGRVEGTCAPPGTPSSSTAPWGATSSAPPSCCSWAAAGASAATSSGPPRPSPWPGTWGARSPGPARRSSCRGASGVRPTWPWSPSRSAPGPASGATSPTTPRKRLSVPSGAVAGSVRYVPVQHEKPEMARPQERFNAFGNFLSLTWLTGSAVVGLVLLRLFPRFAAEFLAVLETQPLPSLGLGVLAMIGTIPVAVLAALTVIGLPVAFLLGAGYVGGMLVGWLFLALAAGSIMVGLVRKGRPWHPSWAFLLGLVVLYVLTRMPFLGGLVTFVGLSFGLGAFLIALYRTWRGAASPSPPSGSRPSVIPAPASI